jgi:hypothetical protein
VGASRSQKLHPVTVEVADTEAAPVGGVNVSYNPSITINATGDVAEAVKRAAKESHVDLLRKLRAAEREDFRRAIV